MRPWLQLNFQIQPCSNQGGQIFKHLRDEKITKTQSDIPLLVNGFFNVNLEMAVFKSDLENEISVWVENWKLETWILKPGFENSDSWMLSKKAMIN